MAPPRKPTKPPRKPSAVDLGASYDESKEYEGQRYTGMTVGRSHKWYYDRGEWRETKMTPDVWQIRYAVTKRRAGRAPEGSGVPRSRPMAMTPSPRSAERGCDGDDKA